MNFERPHMRQDSLKEEIKPAISELEKKEKSPIESEMLDSLEIVRAFRILHNNEVGREDGETEKGLRWLDLYEQIGDFENSIDLSDQIRKLTIEWVEKRIPKLKENIAAIRNLPDEKLSYLLASNWFSELPEVEGQKSEVLLAVMASVVKRIETRMWYKKLEQMGGSDLQKMGIDSSERDLLVDLLKIGSKTNPLFVRFLAYNQLAPEVSEGADLQMFDVPNKEGLFSLSQMFPKETNFLSIKFKELFENSKDKTWANNPGGQEMIKFLELMSKIYAKDITAQDAQKFQKPLEQASDDLINSEFPIVVIPSAEGMYRAGNIDPELRICFKSKDCQEQDKGFEKAKNALVECLEGGELKEFATNLRKKKTKSLIDVGEFGVNLVFKAVAQESKDTNIIFANEERRSYGSNFPKYLDLISNAQELFRAVSEEQKQAMVRMISMFHEYSHLHTLDDDIKPAWLKRLGSDPAEVICEAEADSIYRAYLPKIIEQQGVGGTKEQWACAMLAASLQILKDPEHYVKAVSFTLKPALDSGAISWNGKQLTINNYDKLFEIQKESAKEISKLYRDISMTKSKANLWIKNNCLDKTINEIIKFVAKQP